MNQVNLNNRRMSNPEWLILKNRLDLWLLKVHRMQHKRVRYIDAIVNCEN